MRRTRCLGCCCSRAAHPAAGDECCRGGAAASRSRATPPRNHHRRNRRRNAARRASRSTMGTRRSWPRPLSVTRSKTAGGEGREIPLTRRLQALLAASSQPQGLIFTFKDQPIRAVKTAWKAAIRRAGISYYRFHDLRHAFNTRLMEAGVMQEVRKALMGHSSGEDTNSIYTPSSFR